MDERVNLRGAAVCEGGGAGVDGEVGGIENDEAGIGDDVDVDGDGAGEFAADEVRFEPQIVSVWYGEFR